MIWTIIKQSATVIIVAITGMLVLLSFGLFGYRGFIVTSGSMEPSIPVGSLVLTHYIHPTQLVKGDAITFTTPTKPHLIITHRIQTIIQKSSLTTIRTKGDANKNSDNWTVAGGAVLGKVFLTIPFAGFVFAFLQTKIGLIIFIILPAIYIIFSEIEVVIKLIKDRKRIEIPVQLLFLFLLPSGVIFTLHSFALLSHSVSLARNSFHATIPIQQNLHIVINEVYFHVDENHGVENTNGQNNEWVELYNPTDETVNVKDWSLTDTSGQKTIIHAQKIIPPKSFILVSKDHSTWKYWDSPKGIGVIELGKQIGNGLDNNGDEIVLNDALGNEIDKVDWQKDVLNGGSIQRISPGFDSNSATDWTENNPSPGS